MNPDKRIGLVLSGGGARGIAHLGVIKAIEEEGIKIAQISGTSSGALLAAFYCKGYSPDDILKIIEEISLLKYLRPAFGKVGLLDMSALHSLFLKYFPEDNFKSLKIPLTVAATNINQGICSFFSKGNLVTPLIASCCVPPLFAPIEIDGELYVDGGILNNLPLEPLNSCDVIIGSHCNPIDEEFKFESMKALAERSLLLAISQNTYQRRKACDVFIEPPALKKFVTSDIGKAKQLLEIGYDYTRKFIKDSKL